MNEEHSGISDLVKSDGTNTGGNYDIKVSFVSQIWMFCGGLGELPYVNYVSYHTPHRITKDYVHHTENITRKSFD